MAGMAASQVAGKILKLSISQQDAVAKSADRFRAMRSMFHRIHPLHSAVPFFQGRQYSVFLALG
jgi:hypothetical protein